MELTNEILYLTVALISLGLMFPAYLSSKNSGGINNSAHLWFFTTLLQFLSSSSFAAYRFIGPEAFSIGSAFQFAVDILLVLLFRSIFEKITRIIFVITGILTLAYFLFYDHEDYIHRTIVASLGLISLSIWQIHELLKSLRKNHSIYLVFLIGVIFLQAIFGVLRLHTGVALLPQHGTLIVPSDRFHEDLETFLIRVPILIGYVLVFIGIDNLFFEKLWQQTNRQKEQLEEQVTNVLKRLAAARDNNTGRHILRTQEMMRLLAETVRNYGFHQDFLTTRTIRNLYMAAPLHDVGKVAIPDEILLKEAKLTPREREVIERHALLGEQILSAAIETEGHNPILAAAVKIAGSHHEHWNGKGYPKGLKENDIPLEGRLMAIVDVYDALTSHRSYKEGWSHEEAVEYIRKNKGIQFDRIITDVFISVSEEFQEICERMKDPELGVDKLEKRLFAGESVS